MTHRNWSWKKLSLPREELQALGDRFEREVYEIALDNDPDDLDVLILLGDLYTRQGLVEKGLEVDVKLVHMRPTEKIFHYNLACSHSLLGDLDRALAALEAAVQLGYDDFRHMQQDEDLENLRRDKRFNEILRALQEKHFHDGKR